MAGEQTETLPDELSEWLAEHVAETGLDREEILHRAVMTYRIAEESEFDVSDPTTVEPIADQVDEAVENRLDETVENQLDDAVETYIDEAVADQVEDAVSSHVETELADIEDRIADLETTLDEQIEDVRERVVQVLREAESKAPADHAHPDLAGTIHEVEDLAESTEERLAELEGTVDELEDVPDRLADLAATADELDSKLHTVANAAVKLQRRVGELERQASIRAATDDLTELAAQHGITTATCEDCAEPIPVALLRSPRCPHCHSPFDGVEPKTGFFGSATLVVGDRPALQGTTDSPADEPLDLFEDDES